MAYKLKYKTIDELLEFSSNKGKSIKEIIDSGDIQFINWAEKNVKGFWVSKSIKDYMWHVENFDKKKIPFMKCTFHKEKILNENILKHFSDELIDYFGTINGSIITFHGTEQRKIGFVIGKEYWYKEVEEKFTK